jgi:hypothetical protein
MISWLGDSDFSSSAETEVAAIYLSSFNKYANKAPPIKPTVFPTCELSTPKFLKNVWFVLKLVPLNCAEKRWTTVLKLFERREKLRAFKLTVFVQRATCNITGKKCDKTETFAVDFNRSRQTRRNCIHIFDSEIIIYQDCF